MLVLRILTSSFCRLNNTIFFWGWVCIKRLYLHDKKYYKYFSGFDIHRIILFDAIGIVIPQMRSWCFYLYFLIPGWKHKGFHNEVGVACAWFFQELLLFSIFDYKYYSMEIHWITDTSKFKLYSMTYRPQLHVFTVSVSHLEWPPKIEPWNKQW